MGVSQGVLTATVGDLHDGSRVARRLPSVGGDDETPGAAEVHAGRLSAHALLRVHRYSKRATAAGAERRPRSHDAPGGCPPVTADSGRRPSGTRPNVPPWLTTTATRSRRSHPTPGTPSPTSPSATTASGTAAGAPGSSPPMPRRTTPPRATAPSRNGASRRAPDHAALVFDGDRTVAWCEYGTPEELPNIYHRKEYEQGLTRLPDYRLTCFFVDRSNRRLPPGHGRQEDLGVLPLQRHSADVRGRRVHLRPAQGEEQLRHEYDGRAGLTRWPVSGLIGRIEDAKAQASSFAVRDFRAIGLVACVNGHLHPHSDRR